MLTYRGQIQAITWTRNSLHSCCQGPMCTLTTGRALHWGARTRKGHWNRPAQRSFNGFWSICNINWNPLTTLCCKTHRDYTWHKHPSCSIIGFQVCSKHMDQQRLRHLVWIFCLCMSDGPLSLQRSQVNHSQVTLARGFSESWWPAFSLGSELLTFECGFRSSVSESLFLCIIKL